MTGSTINYVCPEDRERVIDAVQTLPLKKAHIDDVRFLISLQYWCGLRVSEAIAVTPNAIDRTAHLIYLGKTKTRKHDSVIMPPTLDGMIDTWLESRHRRDIPDDHPVVDVTRKCVEKWYRALGEKTKVKALTTAQKLTGEKTCTHAWRKSLGKDIMSGMYGDGDITIAAAQLRHRSVVTTAGYLRQAKSKVMEHWGYT